MSAVGKTCPFCQTPIKPGQEATTCDHCGISHHAECWRENHGCTTYGCLGGVQIPPGNYAAQPTTPVETDASYPEDPDAQNNLSSAYRLPEASELLSSAWITPLPGNKTGIGEKIASVFKDSTRRNMILASILVLVLIALIPTMLNLTEQWRLQWLSDHGDYQGLESFIQDNIANSGKQSHVALAITLLAGLNNESGRGYLESLLYNNSSNNVSLADANGLADNKVKLKQVNSLYALYRNNQDQELDQPLTKLLQLEGSDAVAVVVENDAANETAKDQYDFSKIFQAAQDACPGHLTQIRDLVKNKFIVKLESLAGNEDTDAIQNVLAATNGYNIFDPDITAKISGDIATIGNGKNAEAGIDNNISQLSSQASALSDAINQFLYFPLHAFMVADDGSNIYEIALPEYDYYFGEMPSGNHAILMTTTVSFTSKGWFTINARRLTDVPIQLNQEFGGFTQNWPVYQEVTDSDVADQNAKIQQLSDLNGQINDLQQQKASIDEKNADLHEDIKEQIGSMT